MLTEVLKESHGKVFINVKTSQERFNEKPIMEEQQFPTKPPTRKDHHMRVGILMGSKSDESKMVKAKETLEEFGIEHEWRVLSAHRNPDQVVELVSTARENGFVAFICGAGMAAHLAGVVAAHTTLPVVGVPLSGGALNGQDALYATVQMPKGVPVATVAIDGSQNAALLVIQMLGITNKEIAEKLATYKKEMANK